MSRHIGWGYGPCSQRISWRRSCRSRGSTNGNGGRRST
jgi:hypothetical protein